MLIAGSLQTIMQTFQLARKAAGSDEVERYFEHPYLLVLAMECGQGLCLLAYFLQDHIVGKTGEEGTEEKEKELAVNIFILFPAALLDIGGCVLNNVGLVMSRDAGTYQMLVSSCMVWCGLISIPVFRRNLAGCQWWGIGVIAFGLFVKACLLYTSPSPRDS